MSRRDGGSSAQPSSFGARFLDDTDPRGAAPYAELLFKDFSHMRDHALEAALADLLAEEFPATTISGLEVGVGVVRKALDAVVSLSGPRCGEDYLADREKVDNLSARM